MYAIIHLDNEQYCSFSEKRAFILYIEQTENEAVQAFMQKGATAMKFIKKTACVVLAGLMLAGTNVSAKDNIYAYNKFVSTILSEQVGYCDISASFAGHENEYSNVNDYFKGLISAFYDDIDGDFDNELITVESTNVSVYQAEENGVVYLGGIDKELIENYGDSYTNIFLVPQGRIKYVGFEKYSKVPNTYKFYLYELSPETDEFVQRMIIETENNEDGIEEFVWAKDKTYYSYTNSGGIQAVINPDNYSSCGAAADTAIQNVIPSVTLSGNMADRIKWENISNDGRIASFMNGVEAKTFIKATGLRFNEKPIVLFEDYSNLSELSVKPDIVTVKLDGEVLQFPTQDPVIVDNRTLVPMRTIFEALKADVQWIDENGVQRIVAVTDSKTIEMTIGSDKLYVNGEEKVLDVPAQLMNDKTMVPIRAVSESLDCSVDWNQDTKTVIIESNQE